MTDIQKVFRPFGICILTVSAPKIVYEPLLERAIDDLIAYSWFETPEEALAWINENKTKSFGRSGSELPSERVRNELRCQGFAPYRYSFILNWNEYTHCSATIEVDEFSVYHAKKKAIQAVFEDSPDLKNETRLHVGIDCLDHNAVTAFNNGVTVTLIGKGYTNG